MAGQSLTSEAVMEIICLEDEQKKQKRETIKKAAEREEKAERGRKAKGSEKEQKKQRQKTKKYKHEEEASYAIYTCMMKVKKSHHENGSSVWNVMQQSGVELASPTCRLY